ncbi:hypothetical protein CDV36_012762 [Fusarium kuroshium]|uniref:Uncharacterized protein n=1 Tax=Fusarium kuroshium TaxID=2010991 RepID=A0A3M2RQM6_9HYPO|nr:hypothetical protein CDV36_012762 [Fusarium kuroshium]
MSPEPQGSSDVQDAAPEELLEAFKGLTYDDNEVKDSRAPETPINTHGDLTRQEKVALMGLLAGYASMYMDIPVVGSKAQLYWDFFDLIFSGWGSQYDPGAPPTYRQRSFEDTSRKIGRLTENHPAPGAGRPSIQQQVEPTGALTAPVIVNDADDVQASKHRMAGKPVFLSLTLNLEAGCYGWLYRDKGKKFINPKYLAYDEGLDRSKARDLVVQQYDRRERARITDWNREVVLFLARRRIIKWAQEGSASMGHINFVDFLGPGVIQELVYARTFIQQQAASSHGEAAMLTGMAITISF